jgi:DNA (cytosine-5)-methyltransferase 1
MLTVGDLFSGIGGFSLGLERAGMRTAWFAEVDPYASAVLKKHWPEVPNHGDVRSIRAGSVERVDVLCGGFPCQDISNAGKRAGIDGVRSGLWSEYSRIVGDLRPGFVIVENSSALLGRGMGRVLGDLSALGYDSEWSIVSACAFGAPHARERVFLIAYPHGTRFKDGVNYLQRDEIPTLCAHWQATQGKSEWNDMERWLRATMEAGHWNDDSSDATGMDDGLSARVHACGNAIVPQIAEIIGRAIVRAGQ